jgi:hypothetical protein
VAAVGSGSSGSAAASGAGSAGSGSAIAAGSGSSAGSGSGSVTAGGLALRVDEVLRDPPVELAWNPSAGSVTVTLLDVVGAEQRLVVWDRAKRHDVVNVNRQCKSSEHGAELTMGTKNRIVLRCEGNDKDRVFADEWLIHWPAGKDFPMIYRHWRGAREQRDPSWAGGRLLYGLPAKGDADHDCCCKWTEESNMGGNSITSKEYCKGSSDANGVCVAMSRCPKEGDE